MPKYNAVGINLRLSTCSLAESITPDGELRSRKKDAAVNSEIVEKRLQESTFLDEENVPFPGDAFNFGLNFLKNVPFMQVETGLPPSDSSDSDVPAKALVLHVILSEATFLPAFDTGKPQHLMIDVFFNGTLASSVLIHIREIVYGVKSFDLIFAGTRNSFLTERPWIILPSDTGHGGTDESIDPLDSVGAHERWKLTSRALLEEADGRGHRGNERPPSGAYLESLTTMEMPQRVESMQKKGGKTFGVVDVVVTAGSGKKTMADYLKGPTRMVDDRYKKKKKSKCVETNATAGQDPGEIHNEEEHSINDQNGLPYVQAPMETMDSTHALTSESLPPPLSLPAPWRILPSSPAFINPQALTIDPSCDLSHDGAHITPHRAPLYNGLPTPFSMANSAPHNSMNALPFPPFLGWQIAAVNSGKSNGLPLLPPLSRTLGFPYIGPMPPSQGPPPAIGLFSLPALPKPTDPGLIDPELPRSSFLLSHLRITGKRGRSLVDYHWPVPQRVAIRHQKRERRSSSPSKTSKRNRRSSPGLDDYDDLSHGHRKNTLTKKISRHDKDIASALSGLADPSCGNYPSTQFPVLPPNQGRQDEKPSTFALDGPASDNDVYGEHRGSGARGVPITMRAVKSGLDALDQGPTSRSVGRLRDRVSDHFIMTDPEQLLRRPGKARRPKPSHEAVLTVPTSTNSKGAFEGSGVYDIGTGIIPSVEATLECHLPVKAPQPENTGTGTTPDRMVAAPNISDNQSQQKVPPQQYWPPPLVSPESTHDSHARVGGAPTEVEHNDSSNDNCVIRFAEHNDSPAGQMRQVKSERQGIFKEDMVVMGCRFFVRG